MLRFLSLSSGSCGNCYFLSDGKAGLLIDAGVSVRRLKRILLEHNLGLDSFQAILVTHDHLDHIRHLGSYCKHLRKPVYTTGDLRIALLNHTFTMDYIGGCCIDLPEGSAYRIPLGEDIPEDGCPSVRYFVVPHDAVLQKVDEHRVAYSDIDVNQHVNNARYIAWAMDAIPEEVVNDRPVSEVSINFIKEAIPGEVVDLYHAEAEGVHYVEGKVADSVIFTTRFVF